MEPHKTSGKGRSQGRASAPLKPHPFRTTFLGLFQCKAHIRAFGGTSIMYRTLHVFLAALVATALFGSAIPAALAQSAAPVRIAIDDVVVTEGDSGTVDAVFTVSLSRS